MKVLNSALRYNGMYIAYLETDGCITAKSTSTQYIIFEYHFLNTSIKERHIYCVAIERSFLDLKMPWVDFGRYIGSNNYYLIILILYVSAIRLNDMKEQAFSCLSSKSQIVDGNFNVIDLTFQLVVMSTDVSFHDKLINKATFFS